MKSKLKNGFTLIELLVVIAILGLLSSIVLLGLTSARDRGKNSKITSSLVQLRTIAERLKLGNDYPASFITPVAGGTYPACEAAPGVDIDLFALDGDIRALHPVGNCDPSGGITVTLDAENTAFSAYAPLLGGGFWCVDSSGASKLEPADWTAPTDGSPCP